MHSFHHVYIISLIPGYSIFSVPDAPANFTAQAMNSTVITATWNEPDDANGIILGYNLSIILETDYLGSYSESFLLDADTQAYNIYNLLPFALYRLEIRAQTSVDFGNESTASAMTIQAGMCSFVS